MKYVAFAVGVGGFERGRLPIHSLLTDWNTRLAAEATGLHLRQGYGKTGNFFLTAEADRETGEIARLLCDTLERKFAVFPTEELFRGLKQIQASAHTPNPPPDRVPTFGVVMDVNPEGSIPPRPSDSEWVEFSPAAVSRIRGVWKLDLPTPGGKKNDPTRREGGWGAVSEVMKKLCGGDWTSRSLTTLEEMAKRLWADDAPAAQIARGPVSDLIEDGTLGIVLRPLREPVSSEAQQRAVACLEVLDGLSAKEELEVACRNVLGVLLAVRSRFARRPEDRPYFDTLCDGIERWFRREIALLRFTRPN